MSDREAPALQGQCVYYPYHTGESEINFPRISSSCLFGVWFYRPMRLYQTQLAGCFLKSRGGCGLGWRRRSRCFHPPLTCEAMVMGTDGLASPMGHWSGNQLMTSRNLMPALQAFSRVLCGAGEPGLRCPPGLISFPGIR